MAKSTYFYTISHSVNEKSDEAELRHAIQQIKNQSPAAGYRQVTQQLREQGRLVNHKRVLRIMKEQNLLSNAYNKKKAKYNSYKGTVGKVSKNLLTRRFNTDRPYQKLTTDITEVRWGKQTTEERAYFTCIYDLFSGEVLSYGISLHPTVEFTVNVLTAALAVIPEDLSYRTTVHSDQGFQYQHKAWIQTLKIHRIFQSMSRKATCLDNAVMESFFHILKSEVYYQNQFNSLEELKTAIAEWINYYNDSRCKTKLGGKSPVNYRILTTQKAA